MNFSVVMPIHNEEKYLPYSLSSVYNLDPGEVILLFDRCTDNSLNVARKISDILNTKDLTRFITLNKSSPDWSNRVAFLRRYGFKITNYDIILNTDADIILDAEIRKFLKKIKGNVGLISFGYIDKPFTVQCFLRRIVARFTPFKGYAGIYGFSKKAWEKTESSKIRDVERGEDTFLRLSIQKKYRTLHHNTTSIHMRPDENFQRHYLRGKTYFQVVHDPLWKILIHGFFLLRPAVIIGYLQSKLSKSG